MNDGIYLCEHCSQINFDGLLHPTISDVRALEITQETGNSTRGLPRGPWNLGLRSRIEVSSASCRLCYAICELVRQQPRIQRGWESYSWEDPVCACRVENAAQLGPRTGTSWVNDAGVELSRIELCWHNEKEAEEPTTPGPITPGPRYRPNSIYLVGAFQTCSRSAPALSTQKLFENYDPTPEDYPFSGRVRPPVVDMNLPIRWLEECLINHGPGCGHLRTIEPREPVPKLRFIDVKSKKLTEFFNINISKLKYIALSYVWGRSKYTMLTTKTLFELQTSNFGGSASLPQTIQDAIAVTERLGYQNLWVDSLCIVQDDEDDKDLQIGQMSMIYSQAVLTIVAAAGDSADAGLPGISSVRTSEQIEVALPETNIHPNRSILSTFSGRSQDNVYVASYQDTTWGSRGWTYQEHVLSARLLIFMEQQILWECGTCSWYEESHCETDIASIAWLADSYVSRTKPSKWQGFSNVWNTVSLEVVNYQRRRLTYESDASDAIDGFLNQIEKITGEAFIWGMPVSIFHSSVAYWPMMSGAPVRRACLTTRKVTALKQNVPFPSWSWLGWADLYSDIVYDSDDYCQPGIGYYGNAYFILKNLPLRLEPIGLHELPALPLLLDDVISSSSLLSSLEVEDIPDNQFVCFLAQIIRFSDAKPVQLDDVKHMPTGTTFFAADDAQFMVSELIRYQLSNDMDESLSGDFPPTLDLWNRVIVDKESHQRIGHTAICGEHPGPENATKAPTLVYLKCNYKNVIAVEVVKRQGVCYKVNVARIERTYWFDAASSREVIVLG